MSRGPIVCVTGGRDHVLDESERAWLVELLRERRAAGMIHGDARGADTSAARAAAGSGFPVKAYPYERKHGRRGGAIRNSKMARVLARRARSVLVAFPGGKGTADMIAKAERAGVEVVASPSWFTEWERGD